MHYRLFSKVTLFGIIFFLVSNACAQANTTMNTQPNLNANTQTFKNTNQLNLSATTEKPAKQKTTAATYVDHHNWYVSWGYNKDFWSNSDISVSQPDLNNNFTVHHVYGDDDPGWNQGFFNQNFMSPQYNIRLGHFLNPTHTWAIELNFDHTKYNNVNNQIANVSGTINGQPVDGPQTLSSTYFSYWYHNGFNNLMLDLVRRKPLYTIPHVYMRLVGIAKVGAGVLLPHPMNTILGNSNASVVGPKAWGNYFGISQGWWQLGGWTVGVECGFQLFLYKPLYLEFTDKEAFNDLDNIQVYSGTASQTVWLNELIFSIGSTF